MSQTRALSLLTAFEKRTTPKGKWPHIGRVALANGLKDRVKKPDRIAQKATPLCGPASFLRTVARSTPYLFANAGVELYEKGRTKIGSLEIVPGSELIGDRPQGNTNVADWIMMASLRDSDNWVLSPSGVFGGNLAGITRPGTIASWFKAAGYSKVLEKAYMQKRHTTDQFAQFLAEASRLYTQGYKVLMLIDADVLDPKTQNDSISLFPDHWVALYSKVTDKGLKAYDSPISLTVWTWGHARPVPLSPKNSLLKKYFINKFYGFVAAKT